MTRQEPRRLPPAHRVRDGRHKAHVADLRMEIEWPPPAGVKGRRGVGDGQVGKTRKARAVAC